MELNDKGEGGIWVFDEVELPDGWAFDQLGNRCTVRRGSSPRPAGHPRYFGGGTIPWIKIGDATNRGSRFVESTAEHVNEAGAKCSVLVPAGSLIVANSGVSLGFAAITRVPGCIHDGWLLTTDFRELDRDYLYYCINIATRRLRQLADGTTQPNLNTGIARRLMLPLPPLAEQKAIATILGALDDKIELNRRMNATLEAMAPALFQSWFVDFDPVRAKLDGRQPPGLDKAAAALFPDSFCESEAGHIPNSWTVGKLGELATLSRGTVNPGDFPTETFDHFSLPAFDEGRTPKVELGSAIKSNKLIVTPNSVLLSKLNPHIPRIWLPQLHATRRSVSSTEFMVACPKPGVSREYLFSLFTSCAFASIYGTLVTGTTGSHQRIRPESVLDMRIVIPPAPLTQAFTDITKPMFDRFNRNTEQSRTLASLRDTMLPKLLSGELRVDETVASPTRQAKIHEDFNHS